MVADLVWRHSLAHRIHCMWYGDLTHDGLSELTIVTTGGVHILQVSLSFSTTELKYFFKMGMCFFFCAAQPWPSQESGVRETGALSRTERLRTERRRRNYMCIDFFDAIARAVDTQFCAADAASAYIRCVDTFVRSTEAKMNQQQQQSWRGTVLFYCSVYRCVLICCLCWSCGR